jgi:hypothetical protein
LTLQRCILLAWEKDGSAEDVFIVGLDGTNEPAFCNRMDAHEAERDIRNVPREMKKCAPRFEYLRLVVENDIESELIVILETRISFCQPASVTMLHKL